MKVRTRKVPRAGDPEYGKWEGLVFVFYELGGEPGTTE